MSTSSVLITVVYSLLLLWGFGVGAQLMWQGARSPEKLLNPLFGNVHALRLMGLHLTVCTLDLFVVGPWAIAHKSTTWYWGSRVAVLTCSLPVALYMNRNTESFGKLIGRWVVFRNIFEVGLHVAVASMAVNWSSYSLLLWWIVAYRYLDVGPRRLFQGLYGTPAKLAARPWAPVLNWVVITTMYVLTYVAVSRGMVLFARIPGDDVAPRVSGAGETALVITLTLLVTVAALALSKMYTESRLAEARSAAAGGAPLQPTAAGAT